MPIFTIYLNLEKPMVKAQIVFPINLIRPDSGGTPIRLIMNAILVFDPGFLDSGKW